MLTMEKLRTEYRDQILAMVMERFVAPDNATFSSCAEAIA